MAGESNTPEDTSAHRMPAQSQGRHDAYDIYAEIYELRIDRAAAAPA